MKNDTLICQSCSMPLDKVENRGTEKDNSKSSEYCVYCYKNGSFTNPEATLEEVIEHYAPKWGTWMGNPAMTIEQAKVKIRKALSPLKRWSNKEKSKRCCCCSKK